MKAKTWYEPILLSIFIFNVLLTKEEHLQMISKHYKMQTSVAVCTFLVFLVSMNDVTHSAADNNTDNK